MLTGQAVPSSSPRSLHGEKPEQETAGAAGASTLELLGDPHGLSLRARPTLMADQRLTDCVQEAPDFSGGGGTLTLLTFFLLSCFLFPEAEAGENDEAVAPLPQGSSGVWGTVGIANSPGALSPECPTAVPVSQQTLPGPAPWIPDERLGPALRELASALAANQVWVVETEDQRGVTSLGKPDQR